MKKKYIIATDYDGTLFQYHRGGISDKVRQAIGKFREKGNLLGVVTGRCYEWSYSAFRKENLFEFDYVISNGGAQCCDSEGNLIFSTKLDGSLVKQLVEKLFSLGVEECGVALEKTRYNFLRKLPQGDKTYNSHAVLERNEDFASVHAVCEDEEAAKTTEKALHDNFPNVFNVARNHRCLDITACGVDKASGIRKYASLAGVQEDCIYTVGDNFNDMPMICAFHGCAVENAVDELKEYAEYVCEDIAELVEIILSKQICE